jgi:hypothetical protein
LLLARQLFTPVLSLYQFPFFITDVVPIEMARSRFLDIIVDHFICENVIEVAEPSALEFLQGNDKLNKRKQQEARYEGDPRFALPLMYIANLYETLVGDVNARLASLIGSREKTIGVALEAAGGLYRKLTQKFPKKGMITKHEFVFFCADFDLCLLIRVSYDVQGIVASGGGSSLLPMQQGQGFLNLWYKKKSESVL